MTVIKAHTSAVTKAYVREVIPKSLLNQILLLDLYPASVAYSFRKLRTAYTGYCIKVRRSDNATLDIGFVNNVLDETSLLSFVGASNGYVDTIYSQGDNAENITHTSGHQPLIVLAGVLLRYNMRAFASFNGTSDGLYHGESSIFSNKGYIGIFTMSKFRTVPAINKVILFISTSAHGGTGRCAIAGGHTPSKYHFGMRRLDGDAIKIVTSVSNIPESQELLSTILDYTNSNACLYINGVKDKEELSFQTDGNTDGASSYTYSIGAAGASNIPGHFADIDFFEAIIYTTDQSANRVAIENNMREYYHNNEPVASDTITYTSSIE